VDGIIGKPFDFAQVGSMLTALTSQITEIPPGMTKTNELLS